MAAGILELDRMAVGFVELFGNAWHNHPNCRHQDGPISMETAREIFNYVVQKVPANLPAEFGGQVIPGNYALVRKDGDVVTVLYPSVGDRYEVIQNGDLLAHVETGILTPYNVSLESVGTLLNGQKAFVNIILNEHCVPGDVSKTITRMMYSNSFGGDSYQACVHTTRIVCNNTLRVASAQGAANKTLRKFRHTKNAAEKIENYMIDLADIVAGVKEHYEKMETLTKQKMDAAEVKAFFDKLMPFKAEEGRGKTRVENQRNAIMKIFESKEDLQGENARSRYNLLQAVIDWADHDSTVRNGDDQGGRFWDGVWGNKDSLKQDALAFLME